MRLILGLGSNLGCPVENLRNAVMHLEKVFKIEKISSIYKSKSLLKDAQPDYYNAVVLIDTDKDIKEIFDLIEGIEKLMGKEKKFIWGPRIIDIDIIDWDGRVIETEELTIPHKQMHKRSFVLYPLQEILDNYVHPLYNRKIKNMISLLKEDYEIQKTGDSLCQ